VNAAHEDDAGGDEVQERKSHVVDGKGADGAAPSWEAALMLSDSGMEWL
jgi:hypothetical protein